jgi:hypothetical protein
MQILLAVSLLVSMLKCTLIGHVGFQPLTMDSKSNPTPEGFEPLTKSSRSNSPTNCTLFRAWCKSKMSTQVPSTVLSQFWKGKKQNIPHTSKLKIIFWGGRISKFHVGAGIKQNQRLLPFPRTTKMNVL